MMMTQIENPLPTKQDQDLLRAVYTQARRFMLYRERAQAMQARMEEMPDSLAEAIERDFAAFELEDAARALCHAVRTAEALQDGRALASPEDKA